MNDPSPPKATAPQSTAELSHALASTGYLPDDDTTTALWLALVLDRPLLVEGAPGVGKTALARAAAEALSRKLVRLQCYEGIDEAKALYEWDYAKQLLFASLHGPSKKKKKGDAAPQSSADWLFSEEFLIERPLLAAIRAPDPVVLLVDEIDRSDPELEAMLLELLGERQITIPELGTIQAASEPLVILTSNDARELSDALRRRCLYLALEQPSPQRERAIVLERVPGLAPRVADDIARFAASLRAGGLTKPPSLSESIEWGRAILALGRSALDLETARATVSVVVKRQDDLDKAQRIVDAAARSAP